MNTITTLHQNLLLKSLPVGELTLIAPHLELVRLKSGDRIYDSNVPMQYVYFPTTAIISLLNLKDDGSFTEIAVVGNEGILGISLSLGSEATLSCAVVKSGGFALRLNGYQFIEDLLRAGPMQHQLLQYIQASLTQMAHTAYRQR